MRKRHVLGIIGGIATLLVAPTAYSHVKARSITGINVYSKLENVIHMMEQYDIEYNRELYTEVYYFVKGVGNNFPYKGTRVERALRILLDVETRLLNKDFDNVYRDMIEVIEALEDYFETLEDKGVI